MKTIKRHATRGPRGLVSKTVKTLIKRGDLSDKEICAYIKSMWPEANTSVKAVQYYRHQMRNDGLIPAAKINRRKDRTILCGNLFQDLVLSVLICNLKASMMVNI